MFPNLGSLGGVSLPGFTGSSSSSTGPQSLGDFVFQPKASVIPTAAWIALGLLAFVWIVKR